MLNKSSDIFTWRFNQYFVRVLKWPAYVLKTIMMATDRKVSNVKRWGIPYLGTRTRKAHELNNTLCRGTESILMEDAQGL